MSVLKTYGANAFNAVSNTYRIKDNRIEGRIDGLDAVKQAASLALSVERFEHLIYSLDYGNEFNGFIGKHRDYVAGDIERRIIETLKEDDRIGDVIDFKLSFDRDEAIISFTITSTFGDFDMERRIAIG